mmetsp:Transcript_129037/g.373363  ORF Transcript_129037/g.373363 Transcript_129037/m.373363 type:complete len:182 (+) Transcript_129037:128-673(+)
MPGPPPPPLASSGPMSQSNGPRPTVTAQHLSGLFKDAQSMLRQLTEEAEQIRRAIAHNDENVRQVIEEIDRDIEDETFERKDAFDRLRLEFESFAHRKTEKVVQELEEFTKEQLVKDSARARQLEDLGGEVTRMKDHLCFIGHTWRRAVMAITDPSNGMGEQWDGAEEQDAHSTSLSRPRT